VPCEQCENGKWRWGATGECQYDSLEECEAANPEEDEEGQAAARRPVRALDMAMRTCWAITEDGLRQVLQVADRQGDPEAVATRFGERAGPGSALEYRGQTAVIEVAGPIFRYANLMTMISGASSVEILSKDFQAALDDPGVENIVMEVNSPGGEVTGINEFAQQIYDARGTKPITAYVGGMGASAAYWIASAADEIVADATAELGSIGVVATYVDKRKAQQAVGIEEVQIVSSASPNKRPDPQTEDGRAQIQAQVDALAEVFVGTVARNRGVSEETVRSDFGQGGILVGNAAVAAGLADRLGSLEGVIADLQQALAGESTMEVSAMTEKSKQGAGQGEGAQAGTGNQPTTAAELMEAFPQAAQELRAEAAEAERERIRAVEAQALPGHEALIDQLRLDGQTTGEQAAVQVLQAEQQRKAVTRDQIAAEGEELDQVPGAHTEGGEVERAGGEGKAPSKGASLEERVQHEWENNADGVQAEFSSYEAYLAYRQREEGQVA
jgi:signal peptide peptidase SppA